MARSVIGDVGIKALAARAREVRDETRSLIKLRQGGDHLPKTSGEHLNEAMRAFEETLVATPIQTIADVNALNRLTDVLGDSASSMQEATDDLFGGEPNPKITVSHGVFETRPEMLAKLIEEAKADPLVHRAHTGRCLGQTFVAYKGDSAETIERRSDDFYRDSGTADLWNLQKVAVQRLMTSEAELPAPKPREARTLPRLLADLRRAGKGEPLIRTAGRLIRNADEAVLFLKWAKGHLADVGLAVTAAPLSVLRQNIRFTAAQQDSEPVVELWERAIAQELSDAA